MLREITKIAIFSCALCALSVSSFAEPGKNGAEASPWRFGAGVSAGSLVPIMLEGSVSYKAFTTHLGGFGYHHGPRDFWCGMRGGIGWTLLRGLPFHIDGGIGGGYEFAEAPNGMHLAVNDANKANYLYPYNFKESLDVSAEIRIHLFGFFSQLSFPIYNFKNHDAPDMLWRIGYLAEF